MIFLDKSNERYLSLFPHIDIYSNCQILNRAFRIGNQSFTEKFVTNQIIVVKRKRRAGISYKVGKKFVRVFSFDIVTNLELYCPTLDCMRHEQVTVNSDVTITSYSQFKVYIFS